MRLLLGEAMEEAGYQVVGKAESGQEGIDMAIKKRPDIIILDNMLPDILGVDVLNDLAELDINAAVIIISGIGHTEMIQKAVQRGAKDYILKSTSEEDLVNLLVNSCRRQITA